MSLDEARKLYPFEGSYTRPSLQMHRSEEPALEVALKDPWFDDVLLPTPVIWVSRWPLKHLLKVLSQAPVFKHLPLPGKNGQSQYLCFESSEGYGLYVDTFLRTFHVLSYGQRTLRLHVVCEGKVAEVIHHLGGKYLETYTLSGLQPPGNASEQVASHLLYRLQTAEESERASKVYVKFQEPF